MIDFESVEQVISTLLDADALKQKLTELKSAAEAADHRIKQAAAHAAKVADADRVMAEATAQLVRNRERSAELDRRRADIELAERDLVTRDRQIQLRQDEVARRERLVTQKHDHLVEIAERAAHA